MNVTRRGFIAAATAAAVYPAKAANAPQAAVESIETISMQPEYYDGWPTLGRRKNGELLVVYSGGREEHVCPFGRVELMRSPDNGKSWAWPEVIMDSPIDDRDAGVCETAAGSLLVTTFTSLAYQDVKKKQGDKWSAERLARWDAVERRGTEAQFKELVGTWMLRSTDGGMSWSKPYRVPVNSPHGPTSLSNGHLLYVGKQLWDPGTKVGVCRSTDDGKTWKWLSDIPARPGDSVDAYHELYAIQAANGTVIAQIRNHNPQNKNETLQCESSDGGKTWTTPHAIGVWGLPSHILLLRNGSLLMTYGYRRAPFGNQARISRDHGKTWSEPMTISADGMGGDLGYPSTVELADGKLLTVWYEKRKEAPKAVLRMARWSIT